MGSVGTRDQLLASTDALRVKTVLLTAKSLCISVSPSVEQQYNDNARWIREAAIHNMVGINYHVNCELLNVNLFYYTPVFIL